jgi:hypothetical protein
MGVSPSSITNITSTNNNYLIERYKINLANSYVIKCALFAIYKYIIISKNSCNVSVLNGTEFASINVANDAIVKTNDFDKTKFISNDPLGVDKNMKLFINVCINSTPIKILTNNIIMSLIKSYNEIFLTYFPPNILQLLNTNAGINLTISSTDPIKSGAYTVMENKDILGNFSSISNFNLLTSGYSNLNNAILNAIYLSVNDLKAKISGILGFLTNIPSKHMILGNIYNILSCYDSFDLTFADSLKYLTTDFTKPNITNPNLLNYTILQTVATSTMTPTGLTKSPILSNKTMADIINIISLKIMSYGTFTIDDNSKDISSDIIDIVSNVGITDMINENIPNSDICKNETLLTKDFKSQYIVFYNFDNDDLNSYYYLKTTNDFTKKFNDQYNSSLPTEYTNKFNEMYPIRFKNNYNNHFQNDFAEKFNKEYPALYKKNSDQKVVGDYTKRLNDYYNSTYLDNYTKDFSTKYINDFTSDYNSEYINDYKNKFNIDYKNKYPNEYKAKFNQEYTAKFNKDFDIESVNDFKKKFQTDYNAKFKQDYDAKFKTDYDAKFTVDFDSKCQKICSESALVDSFTQKGKYTNIILCVCIIILFIVLIIVARKKK